MILFVLYCIILLYLDFSVTNLRCFFFLSPVAKHAARSTLSGHGALRWDAMDALSHNWRMLHTGRCTVASCWPRTAPRQVPRFRCECGGGFRW